MQRFGLLKCLVGSGYHNGMEISKALIEGKLNSALVNGNTEAFKDNLDEQLSTQNFVIWQSNRGFLTGLSI